MRIDFVLLALVVGLATWLFRFAPTKLRITDNRGDSPLCRHLGATGPAAIATLFTASILPMIQGGTEMHAPMIVGLAAVLGVFYLRRSVVIATLAGAVAYAAAFASLI